MFNLFKKKQNEVKLPEVAPMELWEERSYMHVLSDKVDVEDIKDAKDRIQAIDGVNLKEFNIKDDKSGNMILDYKGEEYGVGFYFEDFVFDRLYSLQKQKIHDEDFEKIEKKTNIIYS